MTGLRALRLVWPVNLLGTLLKVSAILQPPTNLRIISHNFQHILTWQDPNNYSDISYRVESANQGMNVIRDCFNITKRQCDLTKEFTDVTADYSACVMSFRGEEVSRSAWCPVFNPIAHTVLGPAQVDVVAGVGSIRVLVQPPISYLWSEKEQHNISMLDDYVIPILWYDVQLNNTREQVQWRTVHSGEDNVTFSNLLPRTNYCVSVTRVTSYLALNSYSIPSAPKCVVTGPSTMEQDNPGAGGNKVVIIVSVVFGFLLLVIIVGIFISLDKAGYICMRRKFFPKVLNSLPRSESVFSRSSECTSPTCVLPVEVVIQKQKVEEKQESEDKYCEEGYASRKKLLDSDTSTGNSSGLNPSTNISSSDYSGQATSSSGDDRIPSDRSADLHMVSDLDESWSSHTQLPADELAPSSKLQFNKNEVFNINLNSISIADTGDVWTGFSQEGSLKEEPEHHINADQDCVPSNVDGLKCSAIALDNMDLSVTDEVFDSNDEEDDPADNSDTDDHVVSGYMRR